MNQPAIQQTTNYKKFSLHFKNRLVNWKKVEKLAEKMKKKNLLNIFPIVVNKKNEILDGQHRFEAAKIAKCEIFYLISDGNYDIEDVAESNSAQKGWNTADYIRYYAKCGKPEYEKVTALAKKYVMSPTNITSLVYMVKVNDKIKSGEFILQDEERIIEVLNHSKALGIEFGFTSWVNRPFLRAMRTILSVKGYNKMRMGQKIQANRSKLVKLPEPKQYIVLLEEIYNTNSIEPLRFT